VDALYVGNAYGSTFNNQTALGALIADFMGLSGVEAYTTEAGEASGGAALRTAHMAVASGLVDTALVIGVEKSTDIVGSSRTRAKTVSLDADYESIHGATLPALAALLMRRYMHEFGVELQQFEGFSVNAHANGQHNSHAMFQRALREGSFAKAPMVADPVNLFDGAPDGDGAAAVVITTADRAADMVPQPIRITGSSAATDAFMLQERRDMLYLRAVEKSVTQALSQADISRDDVDLFELHDAFTILSALTLEAAGYAERGNGWQLAGNGAISRDGNVPISTFGGLKSRGNPAGAAGVYQAVEACLQLRHEAGENQIADATHAMIQSLGGCGHTAITHILSR
jgi:acetyl-CoA C-acetyltransferase